MRTQATAINLASQPFGRERAQLAALVALCSVLLLSLFMLTGLVLRERAQASTLRSKIRGEEHQLATLQRQQGQFQNVIGRPSNAGVFSKSVFYNELIARRGVSWTRVFEDLERVMPPDVQLISLRLPQVVSADEGDKNHIELNIMVGAQQPQSFAVLLKNLESSPLFGATSMTSQQPPTQNDPLFRFVLSVPYVQTF
jgi:type IV pilus assembly protein PilN